MQSIAKKAYMFGAVICAVLMIGISIGYVIRGSTPTGFPTVIEPGSMVAQSMVVFKDGGMTYLKDDNSGRLLFSSSSSYSVIQYAINLAQNQSGGSIYLKRETYTISNTLNITKSNITIDADPGTVLTSSVLPILTVWGGNVYNDWLVYNSVNGIRISNIEFRYTGPVQNGKFLYFHKITPGLVYIPGFFVLSNLLIRSTQSAIPTNFDFVGMQIEDMCSARFNYISIYGFGTGLRLRCNLMPPSYSEMYNMDGLKFDRLQIVACSIGVDFGNAIVWETIFQNPKLMYIALYGMTGIVQSLMIDGGQFEGFSDYHGYFPSLPQKVFNFTGSQLVTIRNSAFNAIDGYGVYYAGSSLVLENNYFYSVVHAVHIIDTYATLIGNRYYGYTTIMTHGGSPSVKTINDGLVLEARGIATISGSNYVIVNHGMSAAAVYVFCSFNNTGYGSYRYEVNDANTFNVYVTNPGYYRVYWYAIAGVP